MDISLKTNSATIVDLTAKVLKIIGFITVASAVVFACKTKLNNLNNDIVVGGMDATQGCR